MVNRIVWINIQFSTLQLFIQNCVRWCQSKGAGVPVEGSRLPSVKCKGLNETMNENIEITELFEICKKYTVKNIAQSDLSNSSSTKNASTLVVNQNVWIKNHSLYIYILTMICSSHIQLLMAEPKRIFFSLSMIFERQLHFFTWDLHKSLYQ